MPHPVSITTFRRDVSTSFSTVVREHRPLAISRGRDGLGLLIGRDEVWALLEDRLFTPEVMRSPGGVSIWLPQFGIYGQGSTYAEAREDLLDEVREYVAEYLANSAEYVRAPNRLGHLPHILKAYLADLRGELPDLIFPAPPAPAADTPMPIARA